MEAVATCELGSLCQLSLSVPVTVARMHCDCIFLSSILPLRLSQLSLALPGRVKERSLRQGAGRRVRSGRPLVLGSALRIARPTWDLRMV